MNLRSDIKCLVLISTYLLSPLNFSYEYPCYMYSEDSEDAGLT